MRKLKCFVASSFGHHDVDHVYDYSIKKALTELGITSYRVDKLNHNDKIDSKIIQLISECDFGIVDLTFARPSVYYEAGMLEGQRKSVIFLSRSDHFKPHSEDEFGNFKIHFDLITKNIIAWNSRSLTAYQKLKQRIKLVCQPILLKLNQSQAELNAGKQFDSQPVFERINIVKERVTKFALSKGYKVVPSKNMGFKRLLKGKKELKIEVFNSITSVQLADLGYRTFTSDEKKQKRIIVVCLLKPITKNKIEHTLKRFKPLNDYDYSFSGTQIIFIHPIKSLLALEPELKKLNKI